MTKEEVLQRANDYCSERSYDSETLTDEFKDKFADFFAKKHGDAGIDDEGILDEIKFNLDTAKSAVARGITLKQQTFDSKESEYKKQIGVLNEKIASLQKGQTVEIPDEIKTKLEKLEQYENERSKKEKLAEILELAKQDVRPDLHGSFIKYATDFEVEMDKDSKEQAKSLVSKYQDVMQPTIGSIKPLAPKQVQKRDDEFIQSIPKQKVC